MMNKWSMFYRRSMFKSFQVGGLHSPHLQPHTAKKKKNDLYMIKTYIIKW